MAITASQIATTNTLEQFRTEFNNLRDDVNGLESGSTTFTEISATTVGSTTLNVLEDGTIVFEGATDDAYETTLTVADPTADRTITLPNESGTVLTTSSTITATVATNVTVSANNSTDETIFLTFVDGATGSQGLETDTGLTYNPSTGVLTTEKLLISDGGTLGSASDTDAMAISSGGVVSFSATTEASATGTAAVTIAGGLGVAKDLYVGDDIVLDSDAAIIKFGDNQDVFLTHHADTGLIIKNIATDGNSGIGAVLTLQTGDTDMAAGNAHGQLRFQAPDEGTGTDAIIVAAKIQAVAEGDFSSSSNATSLEFYTASTEDVSGGTAGGGKMILDSSGNLTIKDTATADGSAPTFTLQAGDTDIAADDVLGKIAFQAPDEGTGTDAILVAAAIQAVSEGDFSSSSNATKLEFHTGASEAAAEKMSLSSAGLLTVTDDIVIKSAGTIGGANDTDLLTLGNGILTVAGEISVTTLDIGGTDVTATATELNLIDGGTARGTTALADGDGILINDGGTMRMTSVETVQTYMSGSSATKGFAIAAAIVFG